MAATRLPPDPSRPDSFAGPVMPGSRPGWHLLVLRARKQPGKWAAGLRMSAPGAPELDIQLIRPFTLWRSGLKVGVAFFMGPIDQAQVRLHSVRRLPGAVGLRWWPIPSVLAMLGMVLLDTRAFLAEFRAAAGPVRARLRAALVACAGRGQRLPESYETWLLLFDAWSVQRLGAALDALPARPAVHAVVFHAGPEGAALAATLASLRAQAYPVAGIDVVRPGDAMPAPAAPFAAVLQAGEVLAEHALLLLLREVSGTDAADAAYADEDRVREDGGRSDPSFKPQPGLTMMCSGLLSRGAWLLPTALLPPREGEAQDWAECVRLHAWFGLYAAGRGGRVRRVPSLLTHRRADAEAAPPAVLAAAVEAGLRRLGVEAAAVAGFPVRLRWDPGGRRGVDVIVPSRLRGGVQLSCMLDVLERTAYPHFSMLVVVTQDAPLDEAQTEAARRIEASGRARVALFRRTGFNYSAANNHGAARTGRELICLLNDDVSLIEGDWLGRMAAMFSDPRTGVVGAKLYYPDGRTQHAGVVMGMSEMAQHAHRRLPRGEPGYMARAVLDQEMSAVTGACLMVRRSLFERVGGLDEALPSAFNDVDLCLRVRELDYTVIMAGSVELVHHETISFGHHYGGDPAAEMADVRLMQRRWPGVIAADPYHNPNLSLLPDAEWEPAFPPRGESG